MAFIFGGDTGTSYPELQRRRAIADARAKQARGFPKTIGEGIYSLGESIGDVMVERGLNQAEAAQLARDRQGLTGPPAAGAALPSPPAASVSSNAVRDPIAMALMTQAPGTPGSSVNTDFRRPEEGAQENPTIGADTSAPGSDSVWTARQNAVAGLESGGRYNALGPVTRTGDRAYGKYQVMGANVPAWTEAALGQRLTPQQFLASDQAQDAVFRHRFGQYADRYGEEGAARAWFGGEGNINNPESRDQLGTSVGNYGRNYLTRLGAGRGGGALALASTGVASDAPPILPRVPGAPDEPERTPTDIQPMPRTVLAQAGGAVPATRATIQPYPDPGAEPKPPGVTATMRHWLEMANDRRRYSEEARTEAARRYTQEYNAQKEDFVRRWQDWRTLKNKQIDYDLKLPQTREEYTKTLGETEKQFYERTQRAIAERKQLAETEKTEREGKKPDTVTAGGTQFERPYTPGAAPQPYVVSPGLPEAKEEPLTEAQSKNVQFVRRSMADLEDIDTKEKFGRVLTSGTEALAHATPLAGRYLASEDYRRAYDKMGNWGAALLTHVSGAAVTPSEAHRQLPTFIPQPNDSEALLREKAQRRRDMTAGIGVTAGKAGRDMIEKFQDELYQREQAKPAVKINSPTEAEKLPAGSRFITPDGRTLSVPKRKIF